MGKFMAAIVEQAQPLNAWRPKAGCRRWRCPETGVVGKKLFQAKSGHSPYEYCQNSYQIDSN
ncbi:MAG: hypothetical protein ACREXQ_13005 [Polaromonas sp.]